MGISFHINSAAGLPTNCVQPCLACSLLAGSDAPPRPHSSPSTARLTSLDLHGGAAVHCVEMRHAIFHCVHEGSLCRSGFFRGGLDARGAWASVFRVGTTNLRAKPGGVGGAGLKSPSLSAWMLLSGVCYEELTVRRRDGSPSYWPFEFG